MTFPLKPHPTWDIRDSSKLDTYVSCPRKYFYQYVLGWTLDQPAHDLHFGVCWHIAREHQLLHGYHEYAEAYLKFEAEYRKSFPPETDSLYAPKTPAAALFALMKFNNERMNDLTENEVVEIDGHKMTEISGTVPVREDRVLHYRLDSIMFNKDRGKIFSWDHKTTKSKYIVYDTWAEQFHLGIQNGTYTHCLYCLFPESMVDGVEFCGTGFEYLKKGSSKRAAGYYADFRRVPAFKTPDQMNTWLWNVNHYLDEVDRDMDHLFQCHEEDAVLQAFELRPNTCTAYRGCPYHDYCIAWQNPLRNSYEPPLGFRQEFWNPAEMETTNKMNLEWRK